MNNRKRIVVDSSSLSDIDYGIIQSGLIEDFEIALEHLRLNNIQYREVVEFEWNDGDVNISKLKRSTLVLI